MKEHERLVSATHHQQIHSFLRMDVAQMDLLFTGRYWYWSCVPVSEEEARRRVQFMERETRRQRHECSNISTQLGMNQEISLSQIILQAPWWLTTHLSININKSQHHNYQQQQANHQHPPQ